ncbi:MAG TPA: EAL domain-containing protein, partial [Spirochaetota bacterium]|nr:EAL domain-containing protein [Spirochaetota bacterium]
VFDKGMHSQALHALQVENDLRLALENHEFELFFQPMVALPERRIKGFEALIRWRHPTRGLVSPLDFIPTAEETGLIISIGEWVLTQACEHISAWRLDGHTDIHVAINFSARQFENRNMLDLVGAVMQRTGTPPQALEIEITETVAMKNYDTSIHLLNELHGMGIRISIDDFGTGYSSLGYLKHFPINMLKIDRSFVNDIPGSREDMSITRAIIAMARSLGLDIIAEGVETPEQLAFLEEAGCNFIQGFLFGQPLDARTATTLLEQGLPAIN